MKNIGRYLLLVTITITISCISFGRNLNKNGLNDHLRFDKWEANWITHPEIEGIELGVFLFKKILTIDAVPENFLIHISADNRYKLYVNGKQICHGPARGDLLKWRFETIDLAPYLKEGENAICAKVWNLAEMRPVAQFSARTGLIVQGDTESEFEINTNNSWKVVKDQAYSFFPINLGFYYVVGPGENFQSAKHDWSWTNSSSKSDNWLSAREMEKGSTLEGINAYGQPPLRALFPREIPMMELKLEQFEQVRRVEGIERVTGLINEGDCIIPANSTVKILLDQGHLTNAYPQISYSNGEHAKLKMTYAESLYLLEQKDGEQRISRIKGNRNEIEGKAIYGNYDMLVADGGKDRLYEPLWWRTFRYVELEITTDHEPLIIHQFENMFTGYPLVKKGTFDSNLPLLSEIYDAGWRTQRLCANETFFDCPYYEQLQYVGDTRIQGLVSHYVSGDTILWRKSISDFYDSKLAIGITQSRYPSKNPQLIPTFSLVWITMVYDYMMHAEDRQFINSLLPTIENILQWFKYRFDSSGLPKNIEGWNFVDWVNHDGWGSGVPPSGQEEKSAVIALQYVYTLQKAVEIYNEYGKQESAASWDNYVDKLQHGIMNNCWDENRGLIADTPQKEYFSQHANILGILTNTIPKGKQKEIMLQLLKDNSIAQATTYFKFYLTAAMKKAGLGANYIDQLGYLDEMLKNGLTTLVEMPEPTRSDCHAWSAHPIYYYYNLICGIEPASVGFESINISPCLGKLNWIKASLPHRKGVIKIDLKRTSGRISGTVNLPIGLDGTFFGNDKELILKPGVNQIGM